MQLQLSEERQAQLNEYAQRHGQDPSTALERGVSRCLEWEQHDFDEAVEGIRQGYEDMEAGRVQLASDMFEELRVKYGFLKPSNYSSGCD